MNTWPIWAQVNSWQWRSPRVRDLGQQRQLPGSEQMMSVTEVPGSDSRLDGHLNNQTWHGAVGAEVTMGTVNLLFYSLFRQVEVVMNVLVSPETATHTEPTWPPCSSMGVKPRRACSAALKAGPWKRQASTKMWEWGVVPVMGNGQAFHFKGCLHSDMLLQVCGAQQCGCEATVIVDQTMMSSLSAMCTLGSHSGSVRSQYGPIKAAASGKYARRVRGQIPSDPHGHPPLHSRPGGQHTRDMYSLFTDLIPAKTLIGLLSNEAFVEG